MLNNDYEKTLTRPLIKVELFVHFMCTLAGWRAMSGRHTNCRHSYWSVHCWSDHSGASSSREDQHWPACTVQSAEYTGECAHLPLLSILTHQHLVYTLQYFSLSLSDAGVGC